MGNIEHEKEMIFVKLIRKGPHVLEFSDDYLMVHNGRITLATTPVLEQYRSIKRAENLELKHKLVQLIAELIDREYYGNSNLEWYSLREYIANFNVNRLEELKLKIS
ncbi:MAG: hypothetical protein APF77_23660 [Clostridia bacterium BRH_c25]|nr:MAG: hypothetical protein APF77_18815 [Clostridia bacterium BRH_c25]KUO77196.1 MAG: hypothetical protein APF77_23660 [Clostridia bacterium BRH_c25]